MQPRLVCCLLISAAVSHAARAVAFGGEAVECCSVALHSGKERRRDISTYHSFQLDKKLVLPFCKLIKPGAVVYPEIRTACRGGYSQSELFDATNLTICLDNVDPLQLPSLSAPRSAPAPRV